jgi:hypothetical protein
VSVLTASVVIVAVLPSDDTVIDRDRVAVRQLLPT